MDLVNINIEFDNSLISFLDDESLEGLAIELADEYSTLGLAAFQSKVPVNTGELRDSIKSAVDSVSPEGATASVYIQDGPHNNSTYSLEQGKPAGRVLSLDEVADDLDTFNYKRSHSSISDVSRFTPIAAGDSTAFWQEEAFQDILEAT